MPPMPNSKVLKDMLEGLLGRDVEVRPGDPPQAGDLNGSMVAVYVDDTMKMAAVAGLDLTLAANLGAAIGLVPPGGAEVCVEDEALTPMIAENAAEVCNVLSALLNHDGGTHHKLHQVYLPGEPAPQDAASRLLALGNRLDLSVTVAGYGGGRFALSAP
jgi:hypothetical protein